MEADHRAIVPAMQALTAAARQYRSTDNDDPAAGAGAGAGLAHRRAGAAPGPGSTGRDAGGGAGPHRPDLGAWNQTYNIKPKSPWQLGLDGQWLLDEIDPEGYHGPDRPGGPRTRRRLSRPARSSPQNRASARGRARRGKGCALESCPPGCRTPSSYTSTAGTDRPGSGSAAPAARPCAGPGACPAARDWTVTAAT
jgi:hypothetical protein